MRHFLIPLMAFILSFSCALAQGVDISPEAETEKLEGLIEKNSFVDEFEKQNLNLDIEIEEELIEPPVFEYASVEVQIDEPLVYKFSEIESIKGAKFQKQKEQTGALNAQIGDITLQSSSSKSKNDYMNDTLKQKTELKLDKKYFDLSTGMETKYENVDASKYSQNMFFTPKLKLNKRLSIFYDNRLNPDSLSSEQGVGINYKPKYLKNTNFGMYSSATYQNGEQKSRKTKFISDFYLW